MELEQKSLSCPYALFHYMHETRREILGTTWVNCVSALMIGEFTKGRTIGKSCTDVHSNYWLRVI